MSKNQEQKVTYLSYFLVVLLVVGAYFLGVYKTKSEMIGKKAQVAEVAGEKAKVSPKPEKKTKLSEEEWAKIQENPTFVMGEEDAPVVLVEFTDYECPFCRRYNEQTFSKIKENYVDEGKVRYILRDLPLSFHNHSETAAIAARCVGKEGKYLEMHDKLFENQKKWESLSNTASKFAEYGDELGVDIRECQDNKEVKKAVAGDAGLAKSVGATGTPTFFIEGEILVGAQPYATFEKAIEKHLE